MRKRAIKLGVLDNAVDRKNTKVLKAIVERYGWPTKALVGRHANRYAWLLAQHADLDRIFQQKCLRLMQAAYAKNPDDIRRDEIGHLKKRVAYNKKHLWAKR